MFIVLLKFAENRARAPELMSAHNEWIQRGLDEGVFLLVGSLRPRLGGCILAHGISRPDLEARIGQDPFVVHSVVVAEVLEITPSRTEPRLAFLLDP